MFKFVFFISFGVSLLSCLGFDQTYLKASNTWGFDRFGAAVAVDGDTLVVGAVREDSGSVGVNGDQENDDLGNSGAVYVFVRDGDSWVQEAYLKASNTGDSDQFGASVGISGDTIVVGAHRESSAATGVNGDQANDDLSRSGAFYVFTREEGVWTQEAYLKASNPGENDAFGFAIAIDGDLVVVGAPSESSVSAALPADDSVVGAGAAYLFRRSEGEWVQEAYLKAERPVAEASFGLSVSVSGERVLVGAPFDDGPLTAEVLGAGGAFVFGMVGGVWTQEAYLRASNAGEEDGFGFAVSLDGDQLAVGAPFEDNSATGVNPAGDDDLAPDSGAAYVFERDGLAWNEFNYLKVGSQGGGATTEDLFGAALALEDGVLVIGGYDEDGGPLAVNSEFPNEDAEDAGAAYVYLREGFGWFFSRYLKASNTEEDDGYGRAIALSNGTIVVGARDEDSSARGVNQSQGNETAGIESGERSGAVYVLNPDFRSFPTTVVGLTRDGEQVSFNFKSFPGMEGWQFFGDPTLPVVTDLTAEAVFEEVAPGEYRFTMTLENPEPRFFFQLGQ